MTSKIFERIPTRAEWQSARNAAGGKSGLVSGVSVGDLLDGLKGAGKNAAKRQTAWTKLISGLEKYLTYQAVTTHGDLAKTARSILNHAEECKEAEGRLTTAFNGLKKEFQVIAINMKSDVPAVAKRAFEGHKAFIVDALKLPLPSDFQFDFHPQRWELDDLGNKSNPFDLENSYWRTVLRTRLGDAQKNQVRPELVKLLKDLAAIDIVIDTDPKTW
ncbi:MAG TPA: hypothetical protein PLG23_03330 [Thermoflexales bacterium]|nr:hypothetical protein [Anaerolineae bacterium]HQV26927.1 hypothetical protein [Thermoflexales bacterium]HQY24688.1 hypothetical protein [Thermoflexales bacterium]HQZ52465.1 hypothetical protein [Thermoflexales bacterium]